MEILRSLINIVSLLVILGIKLGCVWLLYTFAVTKHPWYAILAFFALAAHVKISVNF